MSGGKFASLTANLLVRKGAARPSTILPFGANLGFLHRAPEEPSAEAGDALASRAVVVAMMPPHLEQGAAQDAPVPSAHPRRPRSASSPPRSPGGKSRRLMVALTPMEHETLGLVAVKKSVTRHQLLRNAVDEYLALLVEEYDGDCRCIQTGVACDDPGACR
jgi:hypothetical protein